ncbi:MAG TPA: MOSC N-terminal beta barrel domain-containing protein [Terriglobales bacterium]|nr:MOSC N-terminal beta barrel domain-containing protein [Terriglobales bacterium]
MTSTQGLIGSIVSLWRYPVKSMMGEELNAAEVTKRGLLGDRAYALVDSSDGKVASAKNPRKWPHLFDFRAALTDAPRTGVKAPPVRITLPDGTIVDSDQPDIDLILSIALKREVKLECALPELRTATAEEYWPDIEGLDYRDTVTDFGLPEGTFFDCAVVHLLTTATVDRLRALYPDGRFEVRRFRPNVVIETASGEKDFVENAWIGQTLAIGDAARLSITGPCPRCVMTTLPQGDLPKDTGILRTAAQHNRANVGVYASVLQGGRVRRGDSLNLE